MSNSKRWADDGEGADEMVPVDGFFLDGNTVSGQSADATRQTGADKNETQEHTSPLAQDAARPSLAQDSSTTESSVSDSSISASAVNELAMAFWGAPEAFPDAFPKNVRSSPDATSGQAGTPVWSMPPKAGQDNTSSPETDGPGADIPSMADVPSFAPIPLRSAETTATVVFPSDEPSDDASHLNTESQDQDDRAIELPNTEPALDRIVQRESPFKTNRPNFGSQFDPFMGSPLGAPLGVPGGSDFFPGIPNLEFSGSSAPRSGSSFQTDAAPESPSPFSVAPTGSFTQPSPIWAAPTHHDVVEDAGREKTPADAPGLSSDEPFSSPHNHDEISNDPSAEILPWPGRVPQPPIDSPIPVMGSGASSPIPSDLSEDFFGGSGVHGAAAPFDAGSTDLLAEAVESALRNVYGDDLGEDSTGRDAFMAERGLLREGGVEAPEASPSVATLRDIYGIDASAPTPNTDAQTEEGAEDWFGGRFDHQPESFVAEPTTEAATEAVLHYLYGQGRQDDGRQDDGRRDAAALDYGRTSAPSYEDRLHVSSAPHSSGQFTSRRADDPTSFTDSTARRATTLRAEPTFRPHPAEDEAVNLNLGVPWDRPQQNTPAPARQLVPTRQAARLHVPPADLATNAANQSLAEKDSGRLLGVAGLGLIGGITLAGILAVFVFNSFVTDGGFEGGGATSDTPRAAGPIPASQMLPETVTRNAKPSRLETARSASEGRPAPRPTLPQAVNSSMSEDKIASLQAPATPSAFLTPSAKPAAAKPAGPILVSDVVGAAPGPIPISLSITSPAPADAALVSIRGLPEQARLSGGIDVGGGRWLLPAQKLDGLALSVPAGVSGDFRLEAQLMASDVRTAVSAPAQFNVSISGSGLTEGPAASAMALPPSVTPASLSSRADDNRGGRRPENLEFRELLQDGNKLMREGDILNARKYYEKVATTGSLEGFLAMGRSFDPSYFENLPVRTGKPDPALAFEWYKKALEGGLDTAKVKIDNLQQWLAR